MNGLLDDALKESVSKNKPLLVYIHKITDDQEILKKFLTNTIANYSAEVFIVFIPLKLQNHNFVTIGLDETKYEGKLAMEKLNLKVSPVVTIRIATKELTTHTINTYVVIHSNYQDDKQITNKKFYSSLEQDLLNYKIIREELTSTKPYTSKKSPHTKPKPFFPKFYNSSKDDYNTFYDPYYDENDYKKQEIPYKNPEVPYSEKYLPPDVPYNPPDEPYIPPDDPYIPPEDPYIPPKDPHDKPYIPPEKPFYEVHDPYNYPKENFIDGSDNYDLYYPEDAFIQPKDSYKPKVSIKDQHIYEDRL